MGCKGCAAKDAHIASLQEQIEWLRLHNGTPFLTKRDEATQLPWEAATWQSEEEEEIEAMKQAGLLDASDVSAALAQVGAMNTEYHIEG